MAKLYFRYSSMGAGKTLDLLKVAYNYEERGQKALIFTFAGDTRYGEGKITSRTGLEKPAFLFSEKDDIYHIVESEMVKDEPLHHISPIRCILIDESQFLTKKQVKRLTDIVDTLDISVICYGIRGDFQGEPFEGSTYLMAVADSIEEIKTICFCGKKATMNMRLLDGKPVFEGEQVQIGGNESYISVCRKHFKQGIYE